MLCLHTEAVFRVVNWISRTQGKNCRQQRISEAGKTFLLRYVQNQITLLHIDRHGNTHNMVSFSITYYCFVFKGKSICILFTCVTAGIPQSHKSGPVEMHSMSVGRPSKMDEDTIFHDINQCTSIKS